MTLVLELKSDFRDYYDHWFAGSGQKADTVYERQSRSGMQRPAMLRYLKSLGVTTPAFGTVRELADRMTSAAQGLPIDTLYELLRDSGDVVIYTDPGAHGGSGKIKLSLAAALKQFPNHFASEFIPNTTSGHGQSIRYLRIGQRQFWLRYTSQNDWRSNCGNVEIEILGEDFSSMPQTLMGPSQVPIFAIDFVFSTHMYAIDYNIAPSLMGTGLHELIPAHDIFREIVNWYQGLKGPAAVAQQPLCRLPNIKGLPHRRCEHSYQSTIDKSPADH